MRRAERTPTSHGYIRVKVGKGHHLAHTNSNWAYEHRVEAEKKLGRELLPGEMVHHDDKNKANNVHSNLIVVGSQAEHRVHHRKKPDARRFPGEPNPLIPCACGCGAQLDKYDEDGRPRAFVSGHNPHPCPTKRAILDCLKAFGPTSCAELRRRTGKSEHSVARATTRLKQAGLINNIRRGVWASVEHHIA